MAHIGILYATTDGHTERIAYRIAGQIEARGHDPTTANLEQLTDTFDLQDFDAVIVAASIHLGGHQDTARTFVEEHADTLNALPSAFLSVSLTAAEEADEDRETARDMRDTFLDETGWHPDHREISAGAIRYPEYGLLKRYIMAYKLKQRKNFTDTSCEYELTDWNALLAFTTTFLDAVT